MRCKPARQLSYFALVSKEFYLIHTVAFESSDDSDSIQVLFDASSKSRPEYANTAIYSACECRVNVFCQRGTAPHEIASEAAEQRLMYLRDIEQKRVYFAAA